MFNKKNLKKQIFITGTDTEVGKTFIAKLLSMAFIDVGYKVAYYKPIETGCDPICEDTFNITQITGQFYEEALLYQFKLPASPYTADLKENKNIDIDKIVKHYNSLKNRYNIVIVEGAGGLLVPIKKINGKIFTYLDLIKALDVPVIIVAKSTLGTINHTVLTVRALKGEGVDIKGIIMNKYPQNPDWVVKTNPEVIKEMTGIDKIIKIPYLEDISEDIKRKVMLLV